MGARVALTLVLAVAAAACGLDFDHFDPSSTPSDAASQTTDDAGDAMLGDATTEIGLDGDAGDAGEAGADGNPPTCGAIGEPCCDGGGCSMGHCSMPSNKCRP